MSLVWNKRESLDHIEENDRKTGKMGVGGREPLYSVGGNVNWCTHYGKQYGGFSRN